MSRFTVPSYDLHLKVLILRAQRVLPGALAVAAACHLMLTQWHGLAGEERTAKPLTTQFIKRAPRLTKPLDMKKRPRHRRRALQRQMVAVKARADLRRASTRLSTSRVMESVPKPSSRFGRAVLLAAMPPEPAAFAQAVVGTREAKKTIDTSLELMSVDALDTGQYHAMVIQDPRDKRNVRGFFHLHPAYSVSMRERGWHNIDSRTVRALVNLAAAMNEYTNIRASIGPEVTFDSRELFKTPWIYVTAHSETKGFQITTSESSNLGGYLMSGGFVFTETVSAARSGAGYIMMGTAWEIALRQLVKDALSAQGVAYERDYTYEPLPGSHPLYHCFFDFSRAPD